MLRTFVLFLVVAILSGCGPAVGYSGPHRSAEETSLVRTDHGKDTLAYRVESQTLDTVQLSDKNLFRKGGIYVLPGTHNYFLALAVPGETHSCIPDSSFDASGYEYCLTQYANKKGGYCSRSTYTTNSERCIQDLSRSVCQATFNTNAGKEYAIALSGEKRRPKYTVTAVDSGEKVAEGSCSLSVADSEIINH